MKVLLIGGGGREHALAWKLKQSPLVTKIWCAPGNAGIAAEAECVRVDVGDVEAIVALAEKIRPDLTVVGPEVPLVNGIADAFALRNWAIVGPTAQAAKLEGSKIFSKEFLQRHNIPTARLYGQFDSADKANAALENVKWPVVMKADGLCAGKGVFLAPDKEVAKKFISSDGETGPGRRWSADSVGGDAGRRGVVVYYFDGWRALCGVGAHAGPQAGF
jgi:phosphoribosylamine--glycine ligase